MLEVALFCEDRAHQLVVGALLRRLAEEHRVEVSLVWRQAYGGHGRMKHELNDYLRALRQQREPLPDLIVAATGQPDDRPAAALLVAPPGSAIGQTRRHRPTVEALQLCISGERRASTAAPQTCMCRDTPNLLSMNKQRCIGQSCN